MDFTTFLSESDDRDGQSHNILFASAEVAPFSKTGGLGDVAAALPKALMAKGNDVSVITPLYNHLDPDELNLSRRLHTLTVPRKSKNREQVEATIWEGRVDRGVRIFFVEQDDYFGHDGIYGYEGEGDDASAARWAFFGRAIVEFVRQFSIPTDIVHCNDWHTSLAPVYRNHYFDEELGDIPFLFTIHNLGYQGRFPADCFDETGLPQSYNDEGELLHDGEVNYMKGGLQHCDAPTTVSPTYAAEIQTEEYGHGLDEVIAGRSDDLHGILNGADYSVWSPSVDQFIPVRYGIEKLNGKRRNKAELQHRFGLDIRPQIPLLGFVGRLTDQKGLDILLPALEERLEAIDDPREGFQVVILGTGEDRYEEQVEELAERFPRWVGSHIGFSEELAHNYQAGCDGLLIPSRYEPCGLTQLYAMKYGTLPIAHATGGLADTVVDVDADRPNSTGFIFEEYSADALEATIGRCLERYTNYRKWRPLMERAMHQDFSWAKSAQTYQDLYDELRADRQADKAAE